MQTQEINDCWRQRDLLDLTIRRHKSDDKRPFRESDGSEREVWAQRKVIINIFFAAFFLSKFVLILWLIY